MEIKKRITTIFILLYVITAAGSTVYEALTFKRIPIIYCVAQNQMQNYETLKKNKIIALGWHTQIDWNSLLEKVKITITRKTQLLEMFNPLYSRYNGNGKVIIAQKIIEMV